QAYPSARLSGMAYSCYRATNSTLRLVRGPAPRERGGGDVENARPCREGRHLEQRMGPPLHERLDYVALVRVGSTAVQRHPEDPLTGVSTLGGHLDRVLAPHRAT